MLKLKYIKKINKIIKLANRSNYNFIESRFVYERSQTMEGIFRDRKDRI